MRLKKITAQDCLAILLLIVMATAMIYAAWHDSTTTDELAHISAGYSYVLKHDMRLNPEHPPLVKFLAGIPILFLHNVTFPENTDAWQININDQWAFGGAFLYGFGNDAEKIIHAARLAPIFLTLLLGWFIYLWGKYLLGPTWTLAPLFFFTFSPNFIGHGHLVTTDIGAALGVVMTLYYFKNFLERPNWKRTFIFGIALGLALLLKFPVFFVVPILVAVAFLAALTTHAQENLVNFSKFKTWPGSLGFLIGRLLIVGAITLLIVMLMYLAVVWNYPQSRQLNDAVFDLSGYHSPFLKNFDFWLIRGPIISRALGQYILGFIMNLRRAAGGNTTYFLGEISNRGWWYYFPVVYALKEPIPLLALIALGFVLFLADCFRAIRNRALPSAGTFIRNHLNEIGFWFFILGYWGVSMAENLNIGIRHIFPTLPLIYLLAFMQIKKWVQPKVALETARESWGTFFKWLGSSFVSASRFLLVALFGLWYLFEFISVSPYYLAYFNEFAGGPANGYKYVADSNLDWGQNLKYLRDYLIENNIQKIKIDYFGGGNVNYYLGNRAELFDPTAGPQKGWLAISATLLDGGIGKLAPGFHDKCCYYQWLENYQPVAKIGYSFFVYHIQ